MSDIEYTVQDILSKLEEGVNRRYTYDNVTLTLSTDINYEVTRLAMDVHVSTSTVRKFILIPSTTLSQVCSCILEVIPNNNTRSQVNGDLTDWLRSTPQHSENTYVEESSK